MTLGLVDQPGTAALRPPRTIAAAEVSALHASLGFDEAALTAARALLDAAEAAACGLWLVEDGRVTGAAAAVATAAGPSPAVEGFAGRPAPGSPALSRALLSRRPVRADDSRDAALVLQSGPGGVLLVPLQRGGRVLAVAALAGGDAASSPVVVDDLETLAGYAAGALDNALSFRRQAAALATVQRRMERLDVLHDLGDALTERGGSKAFVERLNRLLGGKGFEVEGLAWKSRALVRRLGGGDLLPQERAMLRDSRAVATLSDGRLAVAMRVGRKQVGSMRVRGMSVPHDAAELPFLELLAAGVAEVANRLALRAEVEEAARGTALAHERDRIAADLHDTAGQLFVAIQLLARREAEKLPVGSPAAERFRRLAELADQGKWDIDHAIDALAFFPAARHGLVAAVRALAVSFQSDSELDVIVDVSGRPVRLPARAERALYRVVHESLANAWRHSRCSVVRVALAFEKRRVRLTVTDDGTGLTETIPDRGRVGTSSMRRAITDVGGSFQIRNARPRGVVVEAEIPKDRR
ncbi:MAG: GAF domain-containing protein [Actinomycetota bacterium]|nr:GAF domain-containing protein [Actinomycetota bacterium]